MSNVAPQFLTPGEDIQYSTFIMSNSNENVTFMTVQQFKTTLGISTLKGFTNTEKGTKWFEHEHGVTKAQSNLDLSKPLSVLIPNGDLQEACIVNYTPNENVKELGSL
jgi:hypothetical protein